MPNVYADMIEYASNNSNQRDDLLLSVHTHNDWGAHVIAATELALLAGADRVEGPCSEMVNDLETLILQQLL